MANSDLEFQEVVLEDLIDDSDRPIHLVPFMEGTDTPLLVGGVVRALCGVPVTGAQLPSAEVPLESACKDCIDALEKLGLHYDG